MVANLNYMDEKFRTRRRIERLAVEGDAYDIEAPIGGCVGDWHPGQEPKEIPLFFVGAFAGAFWVAVAVLAWWLAR